MYALHQAAEILAVRVVRFREGVRRGVIIHQQSGPLAQAFGHRLEHRLPGAQRGLLGHGRKLQLRRAPNLALVGIGDALDDSQETRFAGAVAPDQADALTRLDDQVEAIEQGHMAVGKRYSGKLDEGHLRESGRNIDVRMPSRRNPGTLSHIKTGRQVRASAWGNITRLG